jgi:hypothetical protein
MIKKNKPGRPPVAKSIKEFLASPTTRKLFDEGKAAVGEGGGGFAEYDDGKYQGQIVSATMGRSQASGRWQHVLGIKFTEGEYKGQTVFQYQGLENSMGFTILASTFSKLGIEVDAPEDLESADKEVMRDKPTVDFRLRTKGEFQNLIVIKGVDAEESEDDDDSDEEQEDAEVDESDDDSKNSKTEKDADKDEDDDSEEEDNEDEEDEEDEDDEEETKPAPKKSSKKKDVDEDEEEDDEDEPEEKKEDDEEKVSIDVGSKVKVEHEEQEVTGKVVKIDEENSRVKVKLKDGSKFWVPVPDGIVDVL